MSGNYLRAASSHFAVCAAHQTDLSDFATHQTDLSDFATLKASLNFALRHRPRVKLPLASLGGISSNKYAPPIELQTREMGWETFPRLTQILRPSLGLLFSGEQILAYF